MLQIFAEVNDVFANRYLHTVNSDRILVSEAFNIAQQTVTRLQTVDTAKANTPFEILKADQNGNVSVDPVLHEDDVHTIRLNDRLQRSGKTIILWEPNFYKRHQS